MPTANDALTDLYDTLVDAHDKINAQRMQTDDDDLRDAMLLEMTEITHRVDLVQSQLFTEESDALDESVSKVNDAKKALDKSLNGITTLTKFVNACTAFFKIVDTAIDLAKKLP